jgi:hypothetical protein
VEAQRGKRFGQRLARSPEGGYVRMIAYVLADPREIDPRPDAQRIELRRGPDAGQQEQLWRADRPGRQDDLFGLDHLMLPVTDELDAARAAPRSAARSRARGS